MFGNIKPISPAEALLQKAAQIPDVVYEAVNAILTQKVQSSLIVIIQDDLIDKILELSPDTNLTRSLIFENHWLDIEDVYRAAGWDVKYDKPAYCDDYKAHFVFSKHKRS
jgi:hypothetical protein